MSENSFLRSLFDRSREIQGAANKNKIEEIGKRHQEGVLQEGKDLERGKRLLKEYGATVAYLNDLLAAAEKEKAWISIDDAVLGEPKVGELFIVLKQYSYDSSEAKDENDLVLPIDQDHAELVRNLLELSYEDRAALLKAGFYQEPKNSREDWRETDHLDAEHSWITEQLYGILNNSVADTYSTKINGVDWYQNLMVASTEELGKDVRVK